MRVEVPLLLLDGSILFPKAFLTLHVADGLHLATLRAALENENRVGIALAAPACRRTAYPSQARYGCLGAIEAYEKLGPGHASVLLRGQQRFELLGIATGGPWPRAEVRLLDEIGFRQTPGEMRRFHDHLCALARQYLQMIFHVESESLLAAVEPGNLESLLSNVIMLLDIDPAEKHMLLGISSLEKRYHFVKQAIDERLAPLELLHEMHASTSACARN